jgi:hypothetical protein
MRVNDTMDPKWNYNGLEAIPVGVAGSELQISIPHLENQTKFNLIGTLIKRLYIHKFVLFV